MELDDSLKTVVLRWKGPYSLAQLQEQLEGNGIYLLTGKKKYSRSLENMPLYCGITEGRFKDRINDDNHKKSRIRESDLRIWLGEILYPQIFDRNMLERLETCLVSFWQTELNEKKKAYYPKSPICLVSQWYRTDGTPYGQRFPADVRQLEDVLWWDMSVWRVGDLKVVQS